MLNILYSKYIVKICFYDSLDDQKVEKIVNSQ